MNIMISSNNDTLLKGRPKEKGFKGTHKSNEKYNEMSMQIATNYVKQQRKKLKYFVKIWMIKPKKKYLKQLKKEWKQFVKTLMLKQKRNYVKVIRKKANISWKFGWWSHSKSM